MRITLLSQWFDPEPVTRCHALAESLASRGHDVTVVTGFPNYPGGSLYPGYKIRWRQWERHDGYRVLRVPLYPDHSRSVVKRGLNYLSFAASASALGTLLSGPADVLWVYHPPLTVALPALVMKLARRVPVVYEIQDMWPETLVATGLVAPGRYTRLLQTTARTMYRHAAAITVISPGFRDNLIQKGVPASKVHVIHNWVDENAYRPVARDRTLAEEFNLSESFNVVFAGNMGPAQNLSTVIRAARSLADLPGLKLVFIGDGIDLPELKQQVAEYQLTNVQFVGRQPPDQMPKFYALADLLLIHLRDEPLFRITIPSKTTAYLAAGRPIVCAVAGDTARLVEQAQAGVCCPPDDPEALAATIRHLYRQCSQAELEQMGSAGRRFFLSELTREALVDKYEEVFARLARERQ